jgi:single-stranded-DNA-specific exonuclease
MNSAERALKLLISDDYDEACELARDISLFNTSRQETELEILRCADEQIAKLPGLCFDKVLIVQGENWHEGVIGIVASRVAQKYLKPCIVLTTQDGITKGSGRSIEGFPLYDVLVHAKEHLSIYGGHSLAVGLSMDPANIDKFKDAVKEYTDKIEMPYPSLTVDLKLNPEFINVEMLDCLSSLEPFGSKNPAPRFGLYDMVIDDILHIGEKGNHIKIIAHKYGKDKKLQILKFWTFACDFPYKMGDRVDLVVSIEPNEFLGERKVSILLNDIRFYGTNDDEMVKGIKIFEKVMQCRILHEEACYALPSKELLTQIYKYIKSNNGWKYSYDILWGRINNPDNNYAKTAISIEVFKELGILNTNEKGHIIMPENISKVELGNSGILQYLSSFDKVKYGA